MCVQRAPCPGGTAVSVECADRSKFSGFGENPCACTALQQLAALSDRLQNEAPWDDLANAAYCQFGSLYVDCAPVGGVQLPAAVLGFQNGLAGALPPSLGELGPSLKSLDLFQNAITSLPTEIGALTVLKYLDLGFNAITTVPSELAALTGLVDLWLYDNQLTGVPTEFRNWGPSEFCGLSGNAGFSCANVGAGTSCCTADNCPGRTSTCYTG